MQFIRQGATHKVVLGPAVAVGDGFTPVTTLALTTADEAEVILHDNGTVVDISGYTWAAITTADGYYHLTLQSGISNTVGHMTVVVNDDSLCLPLRADFCVLEEAPYDALFPASAPGYVTDQPVNVTKWLGTAAATPTVAGVPEVDVTHWIGTAAATPTVAGVPEVDITHVLGTAPTEGAAGRLAGGITKFFNVAMPTGTVNSLPDAVAGASNGLLISGTNSGTTTFGAVTCSGAFTISNGLAISTTTANLPGISVITTNAHGVVIAPVGSAKAGIIVNGSSTATGDCDAIRAVATGTGDDFAGNFAGNITGDMTGNITGTVSVIETILRGIVNANGTVGSTGNDTTHVSLSGVGTFSDNELNSQLLVIYDTSASEYHARWIEDYADTNDLAQVATLPFTPVNTDLWWLLPVRADVTGGSGLDAAGVRTAIGLDNANLLELLGLIAGKQAGDSTARTDLRSTGAGSGTYDETTDSLEALVDNADTLQEIAAELLATSTDAGTVQQCLEAAWAQGFGKWSLSGTTLRLYAPNGSTVLRTFTVDSASAPTTRTPS